MQKTYFSNYANEIKFTVQKLFISTHSVKDKESNQMWAFIYLKVSLSLR